MQPRPLDPPVLEDGRVRVRALRVADAEPYAAAFRDDPDLGRLGGWDEDPDEDWLRRRVAEAAEQARIGKGLQLAIARVDDDRLIGDLVLNQIDWKHEKAEIGLWLVPSAQGQGLAHAATRLLLRWAVREVGLHRIELKTTPENAPALALAARLGFTREGLLRDCVVERGVRVSLEQWSLLATDEATERL